MSHVNCVGSSCASDGIGQKYFLSSDYCSPVGTPGVDSDYSASLAKAAAAAAPQPAKSDVCSESTCTGEASCAASGTTMDVYYVDDTNESGLCYVWAFKGDSTASPALVSGHVHIDTSCLCPSASDLTWNWKSTCQARPLLSSAFGQRWMLASPCRHPVSSSFLTQATALHMRSGMSAGNAWPPQPNEVKRVSSPLDAVRSAKAFIE